MLGVMRVAGWIGWLGLCGAGCLALGPVAGAQSCVTQAKMTAAQRSDVGGAAYRIATDVLHGDIHAVQAVTIPQFAGNFGATADLIHTTAEQIRGDQVAVTQVYLLDASQRTAGDAGDADFSCPLSGVAAETDFAIGGLPPGRYAFVVVEATGAKPWDLAFLLQASATANRWEMAGFYPHTREAAGHNGLWYWTQARADVKAGKDWLGWLLYGEADQLLRPANFVSSTNLDRLRSERRTGAPPALGEGIGAAQPITLQGQNGAVYRLTGLNSEASQDGSQLNLVLHLHVDAMGDDAAATARNLAAATALLAAHPELRTGFHDVWVIAEAQGANPVITVRPMAEIPGGK